MHEPAHLVAVRNAAKPPSISFELAVLNKDVKARSSESFSFTFWELGDGSMYSTSVIITTKRLFDD